MKFRVTAIAVGAVAAALLTISPASAQATAKPYDHKDPYQTGCGNSAKIVKTGSINSRANGKVGTIQLWWSGRCKTNWIEIKTATSASGSISVYTEDGRYDRFAFKKGNGGRHWGNMLSANNMCAWGGASVQWNGGRGGQNGAGSTAKACG
ncbi:DUF2690 domain-containing protein [Nonomuraea sp. NPDC050022]|uniref:DUF2690 domain-containing protein n=1 Tax=unclassified Nonomuraea TaxID=2593643 RepID=UPI0033ED2222